MPRRHGEQERFKLLDALDKPRLHRLAPLAFRCHHAFEFSNPRRSEEHTSELQSLMRISYAVFCLKKKTNNKEHVTTTPLTIPYTHMTINYNRTLPTTPPTTHTHHYPDS